MSISNHDVPSGIQFQASLDGLRLSMPGPPRPGSDAMRWLALLCPIPFLFVWFILLGLGHGLLLLLLGIPLFLFVPWLYWKLGILFATDDRIRIEIQPHTIQYTHRKYDCVVPIRAIRMIDSPEDQEPQISLKLDWSDQRIECPKKLRGAPMSWMLETHQQAHWLAEQIHRISMAQESPAAVPETIQALLSAAQSQSSPDR